MSRIYILLLVSCMTCLGITQGPDKSLALWVPKTLVAQNLAQSLDTSTDPFEQAKKLAKEAVIEGETAWLPREWEAIAAKWERAGTLMDTVPPSDDRYSQAQDRAELYRQNSQIATEEVEKSRRRSEFPPFESTVSPGSTGMLVSQLQYALRQLGYFDGKMNGKYGESTSQAVAAFQAAQGVSADGIAGARTWELLETARSELSTRPRTPKPTGKPTSKQSATSDQRDVSPTSSDQPGWLLWVLLSLVALIVVAGLVFLLLKYLNSAPQAAELDSASVAGSGDEAPDFAKLEPVETEANNSTATAAEKSEQPKAPVDSLTVTETSQLAKIDIVDELIKELTSPDRNERSKAIWELGQQGTSQASEPLLNLLLDSDSHDRSLILAALSEIGVRTFKPMHRALAMSLQDNNPDVRKNAIRDLTRMYELIANVNQMVRYAVEDPDDEVRETAQWAINQLSRISMNLEEVPLEQEPASSAEEPKDESSSDDD